MLNKFKKFIKENSLFNKDDKILLAVSGGIDSVVMTDLFAKANYKFAIAHCNFKLRGKESDEDQIFVQNLSKKYGVEFYTIEFNTLEYARANKLSIQMAARELRYAWLEKIRNDNNYQYIAVAHNADDSIETFFINLTRGTGIKGLTGISNKNGNIIRPLLFATRKEIIEYCKANSLIFREDSSNKETKYLRNKIRHLIIPKFEAINKNFKKNLLKTIEYLNDSMTFLHGIINDLENKYVLKENKIVKINYKELLKHEAPKYLLFSFLYKYGFKNNIIKQIFSVLNDIPGKTFISKEYKVIKDRDYLIIELIENKEDIEYQIDINSKYIEKPIQMLIEIVEWNNKCEIVKDNNIGYFDYDKIKNPLILRKWKYGDKFMPLGMKNFKKLSDFFIDNKFSLGDKQKTWLLISNGNIIWVIGHRIDERYKITENTKKALIIKIKNS